MGEARQVIQVPGAPPVSIRWGARGAASQGPATQVSLDCQQRLQVLTSHDDVPSVLLIG